MRRVRGLMAVAVVAGALAGVPASQAHPGPSGLGPDDWRTYQHDAQHSGTGVSHLDAVSVQALRPRWFFPTNDIVTAQPIAVGDGVYVGTWDGVFYKIDRRHGTEVWHFDAPAHLHQPKVETSRSDFPGHVTSDGGFITSSAWYEPAHDGLPNLVIVGAGNTLYALDAADGSIEWERTLSGRPESPDQANDPSRIFASPVVSGNHVLIATTADGDNGWRGYAASVDLGTGALQWRFETDRNRSNTVLNDGCGGVWASPSVDPGRDLMYFDVADCHFRANANDNPFNERVIAVHISDGSLAWTYSPRPTDAEDNRCDWDFGASVNVGDLNPATHKAGFVGVGGKDGTYYRLNPDTGAKVWAKNVVWGGFAGGFIQAAAYDGTRVYGATALGDFGRFESARSIAGIETPEELAPLTDYLPIPSAGCDQDLASGHVNPADQPFQDPSIHAFGPNGDVVWQNVRSQSFGPTTTANGLVFVGLGIDRQVQIRDGATGLLVRTIPVPAPSDSGIAVAGRTIYFGIGSSEQSLPSGVMAWGA